VDAAFSEFEETVLMGRKEEVYLLVDEQVLLLWSEVFIGYNVVPIRSGESAKSLAYVEEIVLQLIDLGADRNALIVGVGGGVTSDLAGFVASVYMRGVKFGFVPTTLLSQVDASIGGKNGVNAREYKNMIGVINQPDFIFIDLQFLETLPEKEFIGGLAEVIKHACIKSLDYFQFLELNYRKILALDKETLLEMILASICIKSEVVENDAMEKGERKLLNYGHTYGHAIEKTLDLSHGEAVSLGIIISNSIGQQLDRISEEESVRIKGLLDVVGLPTEVSGLNMMALSELASKDKKKMGDVIDFVLLNTIGTAVLQRIDLKKI